MNKKQAEAVISLISIFNISTSHYGEYGSKCKDLLATCSDADNSPAKPVEIKPVKVTRNGATCEYPDFISHLKGERVLEIFKQDNDKFRIIPTINNTTVTKEELLQFAQELINLANS